MVERHRNTHPIGLGVRAEFADEEAVVQDVVVGERGSLRKTGSAGCVLNVDRVIGPQRGADRGQLGRVAVTTRNQECIPARFADEHRVDQVRAVRPSTFDHGGVAGPLELRYCHHGPDSCLAQHEGHLMGPIRRVDGDQNRPNLGRPVLHQRPFGAVRRPNTNPVTGPHTEGEQSESNGINITPKLVIGPPSSGLAIDHCVPFPVAIDDFGQVCSDGVTDQCHR